MACDVATALRELSGRSVDRQVAMPSTWRDLGRKCPSENVRVAAGYLSQDSVVGRLQPQPRWRGAGTKQRCLSIGGAGGRGPGKWTGPWEEQAAPPSHDLAWDLGRPCALGLSANALPVTVNITAHTATF